MGISVPSLLIILLIVVLLFGTKRLKSIGSDLGSALKGFKKAVNDEDADFKEEPKKVTEQATDATTTSKKESVEKD
ncbi:twin-arginine translocase TatA/TatE family subunit [Alteromonas sediminis]|uniref:Sec-independent protein translocase protein TatA n=1 Tax=Alteromonas sediminis TaxID=2259342 RepID=A0A3N5YM44_9ALTE|nr:twin-arginine translocase TatA/TatE family subunit [Alteromonas sediminis]RPJ66331.1 twin-arginine translocase TatA/TatE family subunit [Alteromonas sediminis]